jgi:serine/threonine protein kinase
MSRTPDADRVTPSASEPPAAEAPPRGLPSRYRIERIVGRGGMGVVTLAIDERLGRPVAIKSARAGTSRDERKRRRFLAEARATAQLAHPSIVPVHDLVETDEGELAFSMSFVEGRSLSEAIEELRRGTEPVLSRTELLLAFTKICDAIAYAHDRGVLHRDLKPQNVMLGRFGEVLVMDWGLAGARETDATSSPVTFASEPRETAITTPGTIVGSPGYVAPELVRGAPASVASDVFALGAILYEMLALVRAIPGDLPAAILANTVVHPITSPRERAPSRDIGPGLEAIVMRALAPEPSHRFESVLALRAAIAEELELSSRTEQRRAQVQACVDRAAAHRATLAVAPDRRALRRAFLGAHAELAAACTIDPDAEEARAALIGAMRETAARARALGDPELAEDIESLITP